MEKERNSHEKSKNIPSTAYGNKATHIRRNDKGHKKCRKMFNETGDGADCNVCSWKDVEVGDMTLCGEDMLKAIEERLRR